MESDTRSTKVERVIAEYDLDGLGEELLEFWTLDGDERKSLRELEDYFNIRVLEAALERETHDVVEGEVENYYRLLRADDVSPGSRVDAEHRLEAAGIEVDRLRSDFISHQGIHTYLKAKYGAMYETNSASPAKRRETTLDTINRLRNRLSAVAENSIQTLVEAGVLNISDLRISVLVQIECDECNTRLGVRDFFEEGSCECPDTINE